MSYLLDEAIKNGVSVDQYGLEQIQEEVDGAMKLKKEEYEALWLAYEDSRKTIKELRSDLSVNLLISSTLYCCNCKAPTKHEKRDPDVCCMTCDFITVSEHPSEVTP
jgi:hypothetical protein